MEEVTRVLAALGWAIAAYVVNKKAEEVIRQKTKTLLNQWLLLEEALVIFEEYLEPAGYIGANRPVLQNPWVKQRLLEGFLQARSWQKLEGKRAERAYKLASEKLYSKRPGVT